ncbi:MAG: alpha/beta hydrolase [Robiginitalea sp.]|uniref:alpha/beta hydrolase n=2 Tax=Robiginitalea sp. TaxID=1902411 RepID=UPI003C777E00
MRIKQIILIVLILTSNWALFGQLSNELKQYKHHSIISENDTVNYHTYSKTGIDSINTLFLYLQGSSAKPLYQVKEENGGLSIGTTVPFDFATFPEKYLFVVISRKGLPFSNELDKPYAIPQSYFENQTLEYRANQADLVIKDLLNKHSSLFDKIIVLGHSEGSDVVAKLGTINKEVTHFGYWSGGGNTQFIDFITFIRKDVDKNNLTEEQAKVKIDSLFNDLKDIMANPDATDKFWEGDDNSYKRWSHFSEPPVDNLLQIEKPIYVAIGTKDQAVALESAYLIPIEFIRHRKTNLTFKVYPDLDHGFARELENGEFKDYWNEVFEDFLDWVNRTN